jgi:hypothetical protein
MQIIINHIVNNWTVQDGPGTIEHSIFISPKGLERSMRGNLTQGSWTENSTREHLFDVLRRCRQGVADITARPETREQVVIRVTYDLDEAPIENGRPLCGETLYSFGSYSPRHRRRDVRDSRYYKFAAVLINYIEGQDISELFILDYIMEEIVNDVNAKI